MVSDLAALKVVFGCGALGLIPLDEGLARKWMLTALNLLFLGLVLSHRDFLLAVGLIVFVYLLLKAVSLQTWRGWAALALGTATLGLFLLHKLPHKQSTPGELQTLLAAVGFSYVTLRILDILRAIFERRHPAPDLSSTVNYLVPFHMLIAGPI